MTIPRSGDRIRLIAMLDDPDRVPLGSTDTLTFVHEHGSRSRAWLQIGVEWDNGSGQVLAVPPDEGEVVRSGIQD